MATDDYAFSGRDGLSDPLPSQTFSDALATPSDLAAFVSGNTALEPSFPEIVLPELPLTTNDAATKAAVASALSLEQSVTPPPPPLPSPMPSGYHFMPAPSPPRLHRPIHTTQKTSSAAAAAFGALGCLLIVVLLFGLLGIVVGVGSSP